jgi:hypothetical protein
MDQYPFLDRTLSAKELSREVYEADEQGDRSGDHEGGAGREGIHVEGECVSGLAAVIGVNVRQMVREATGRRSAKCLLSYCMGDTSTWLQSLSDVWKCTKPHHLLQSKMRLAACIYRTTKADQGPAIPRGN